MLITGTRHGWDDGHLRDVLAAAYYELALPSHVPGEPLEEVILVHGDAPGVDTQAATIWREWGLTDEPHPAIWSVGKKAGPIRNRYMVDLGADLCLAFVAPDSRGTIHCARIAEEAGIPVERYTP